MAEWYLGTMGFSYADWVGSFYPEALTQHNYLKHYRRFFNAVEIDSTFYGTPRLSTVQRWLTSTPDSFQFCPKTPRIITHDKRLRSAHLEMAEFITVMRELKNKLGVILIQLPPTFRADQSEILSAFLKELPKDVNFAVEFRHHSWYQPRTAQILKAHHICWAATEYPDLPPGIRLTSGFVYFRLIGRHGQFKRHDHEQIDRSENLQWWYQNLSNYLERAHSVYGFFNNDYAGFGVLSCNQFKQLVGLPAPDLKPPQQGRLF
jgi:uncharacterized protein YecE (DUF72 family)